MTDRHRCSDKVAKCECGREWECYITHSDGSRTYSMRKPLQDLIEAKWWTGDAILAYDAHTGERIELKVKETA